MVAVTKTQDITLISLQQVSANSSVSSSAQDVSTKLSATIFIHYGRDTTSGSLTEGVDFRIEASAKSSGNDTWFTLQNFKTDVTAPESESLTGTISVSSTTLTVNSTANLSVGDLILIKNSTAANSEFHRIKQITTNTNIKIIDGLANVQTGSTVYNKAEFFVCRLNLLSIGRIRLVVDATNTGTGKTCIVEAYMITGDSLD